MLNLFHDLLGAQSVADLTTRHGQAHVATIEICERAINRGEVGEQLQCGLNSRVTIEQARGVRAPREDRSMDAASDQRAFARRRNERLSNLARQVVETDVAILVARYPRRIARRNEFCRQN